MMNDPFSNGYTLTQLTNAIRVLPNMYGRITELGLFKFKGLTNRSALIESYNGTLRLVPTTPWGGPAPKNKSGKRNEKSFAVPHMPLEDTVAAAEVMGVRAFGTENTAETVNGRVNDKLQDMKNKIDQTLEWRMFNALKGYVVDADGSVMEDYFAAFSVTPKSVFFDLANPAADMREKCMEVVRHMEDNLMGERMTTVRAPVSPEFFDGFVKHASVKAAYAGWQEAAQRLGGDLRKGFTFGGIVFEEYRATVDGQRFIDSGEGHAFPMGTMDTFTDFGAPADFAETVNTIALPYYARQKNTDFNRGVDIHAQANRLPMVTRPALLVKLELGAS